LLAQPYFDPVDPESVAWNAFGLHEANGMHIMTFNGRTTSEEVLAELDLTGKTVVVTGTSSGLGQETARLLAAKGAEIVMVARNAAKNAEVAAKIRAAQPDAKLDTAQMELSDRTSVRRGAAAILAAHPKIDALINNAGMMGGPYTLTPDGEELHFAANHIGPFLLTNLLYPALKAAAPSRVVILSSAGHRLPGLDFDDLTFAGRPYDLQSAYCQSKRANVLHAVALAKRWKNKGIGVNAVHPGAVRTEVFRHIGDMGATAAIGWSAQSGSPEKTPSQGAATAIWAAFSPEAEGLTGLYFEDCAIARHIPSSEMGAAGVIEEALDPATAERLWAVSEAIVGERFVFD
jgi:NAD(P)-dependent dehydrogenase (short-subunit alcohol dehydrogenase family)